MLRVPGVLFITGFVLMTQATAVSAQDSSYETRALRIEGHHGDTRIVRGADGNVVGTIGIFRGINVEELVSEFGESTPFFPCDVSSDDEIRAFFENVRRETDRVDLMLHSLAFAPREALEGDFVSTTREAFRMAQDVSAYSLVALAREAAPLMINGGSIVAMTYYGSEKVVPHYNVMGVAKASLEASTRYLAYDLGPKKIRINCISAGPVQTLAARGISLALEVLRLPVE